MKRTIERTIDLDYTGQNFLEGPIDLEGAELASAEARADLSRGSSAWSSGEIELRGVAPGASSAKVLRSAVSAASRGVSASSDPVAKPPWATSKVAQTGTSATGARSPMWSVPAPMPSITACQR